jgi:hypothetical protein
MAHPRAYPAGGVSFGGGKASGTLPQESGAAPLADALTCLALQP